MGMKELMQEKRDRERAQREKEHRLHDAEFIADPDQWPRWPLLPVKRPDPAAPHGLPICGVMFGDKEHNEGTLFRVYEGITLFSGVTEPGIKSYADLFARASAKLEYATIEALQQAGWEVD